MAPNRKGVLAFGIYLPADLGEQLKQLSRTTRIPQAEYFREAVRDLLAKYASPLKTSTPKSKRRPDPR